MDNVALRLQMGQVFFYLWKIKSFRLLQIDIKNIGTRIAKFNLRRKKKNLVRWWCKSQVAGAKSLCG